MSSSSDANDVLRAVGEEGLRRQLDNDRRPYIPARAPDGATLPGAPSMIERVNEDAIAQVFVERYKDRLRYDHDAGRWLRFDSTFWEPDRSRVAFHLARLIAREANAAGKATPAKASTAIGVERFAQADPELATTSALWDQDPWLLATPAGTVDLRTGNLRPAQPMHFITKQTAIGPAEPGTPIPIWSAFLEDVTRGDEELIAFLKRMSGYCLTGDTSEHAIFFLHGSGGNGKGVYLNTLTGILRDHASVAMMETFTFSASDRHPTELAMLCGARLVTAQETQEGRGWNESRLKALTGGDRITARFMNRNFFTYQPAFKLLFAGNHKPNLRSVDDAMRRRINMVPFTHKPANPDPRLPDKIREEWRGILRWAIDGCLEWQQQGLRPPEIVRATTGTYFEEQDLFGQWLAECCEQGRTKSETAAALYESWKVWIDRNGGPAGDMRTFSQTMVKRGFEALKHSPGAHGKRGFRGLSLNTAHDWQQQQERGG